MVNEIASYTHGIRKNTDKNAYRQLHKIYNDSNCRQLVIIALKGTGIIPAATAEISGVQRLLSVIDRGPATLRTQRPGWLRVWNKSMNI